LALPNPTEQWDSASWMIITPASAHGEVLRLRSGYRKFKWSLLVDCDLPYLTKESLNFLIARARRSQAEAVPAVNLAGREPFCAMYYKRYRSAIRSALKSGTRKGTDGLANLPLESIGPPRVCCSRTWTRLPTTRKPNGD